MEPVLYWPVHSFYASQLLCRKDQVWYQCRTLDIFPSPLFGRRSRDSSGAFFQKLFLWWSYIIPMAVFFAGYSYLLDPPNTLNVRPFFLAFGQIWGIFTYLASPILISVPVFFYPDDFFIFLKILPHPRIQNFAFFPLDICRLQFIHERMNLLISLWLVFLYCQRKMSSLFMNLFHDCSLCPNSINRYNAPTDIQKL